MERYNPEAQEAFREQKLKEAQRKLDEIYIEHGNPNGYEHQLDPIREREANFLLNSGAIREEDIILNDKNPNVDPARRQRYAEGYAQRPIDRERDLHFKAYELYPELFVVTQRTQEKFNNLKEKVIPDLEEDIWSLSPRPTNEQIQSCAQERLKYNLGRDPLARTIREIEACANYALGTSRALDSIRFAYPGYTQEDFRTLFLLLDQSFRERYDEDLPSREEMLEYRGKYDIAEKDALGEQSLP